eukprot:2069362-Prymnesium_polylepis.1
MEAEPAVLEVVRRLEAGEEVCDEPPEPTYEESDAWLALWDAWEARCNAMREVVEPLLPRAREMGAGAQSSVQAVSDCADPAHAESGGPPDG